MTPSAKWKFLGMITNYEGHGCGTVTDDNIDLIFGLVLTYVTSVLPSTAPLCCFQKWWCVGRFLFCFLSPALPISVSENEIPDKCEYSNICSVNHCYCEYIK